MPDVAQHHAFGLQVQSALPREIQEYLCPDPYVFALYGPDLWFMYQPWKKKQKGRGRRMHTTRTGEFLTALAEKARSGASPRETFSYLAGFLCHYALDSTAHPYIVWMTTRVHTTSGAHRDLEHALDAALLKSEGLWGQAHPVTDVHFPLLRLPQSISPDLDAVYGSVYGWKRVVPALNRCLRVYRQLYRVMEKPLSFLTRLARLFPTDTMRSLPYICSAFLDRDAENLSHEEWAYPCAPERTSRESYPDLVTRAREEAVRMIRDCYAFAVEGTLSISDLSKSLGRLSYLSGLDWDDPRNRLVPSLRPWEE